MKRTTASGVIASLVLCGVLTCTSTSAFAQEPAQAEASALTVTVQDPSGARIEGAELTLTGPGLERKAVSDASGVALFSALPPGDYDVRGVKAGFAPGVLRAINVHEGTREARVMSLGLPGVKAFIEVVAPASGDFGLRSGIPIEQAPQSVQVLDEKDIIERGATMVEDVLRAVPSASVAGSRVGTSIDNTLRIRGLGVYEVRNGMRQRWYGDIDTSALSNIQEMQVLKGPSGVLYGQSGPGGLVSIITKQPTENWQGSIALTGGSFEQKMATVDVGGLITKTLGIRLTGEIERSGTFVRYMPLNRENLGLTLAWRPSKWVSAHLVTEYAERETVNNPGLPTIGTVNSNGVSTVSRSTFLGEPGFSLQENHAPLIQAWADVQLSHGWTLTPRFQYSEFNNLGQSTTLLTPVAGQPTLIQRTGRFGHEHDPFFLGQLDLAGQVSTFGLKHKLTSGFESTDESVNFRMEGTVPCGVGIINALDPVYGCGPRTTNFAFFAPAHLAGYAGYVQDQVALTSAWNVVTGFRYSDFGTENGFITAFFGSTKSAKLRNTTWQLGTSYALGQGLSLFGGYNTGYDLEWVLGARSADGTPFKPQTSDQAEAGLRLTRKTLRASASTFRSHLNNVAVPDPANLGFQIQEGQFRVQGVELEGEWSPRPGWWLQSGYAYLDAVVSRSTDPTVQGGRIAGTPANSVTGSTRVAVGKRLQLRVAGNYVGSTRILNGGAITIPAYFRFDFGAGTSFGPVRLDATLTNAFDKTYYFSDNLFVYSIGTDNRVLPGTPRSLSVRVSYRFGGRQL